MPTLTQCFQGKKLKDKKVLLVPNHCELPLQSGEETSLAVVNQDYCH